MNTVEIGLLVALLGAVTYAAIITAMLHAERRSHAPLRADLEAQTSRIRTLENRALEIVQIDSDKTVQRLPGESLAMFAQRADLEALRGRDDLISAIHASGQIKEHIEINTAANTARILHTLKVTK